MKKYLRVMFNETVFNKIYLEFEWKKLSIFFFKFNFVLHKTQTFWDHFIFEENISIQQKMFNN